MFSRVVKEIVRFQPDIISLVEVDYMQFFLFFFFFKKNKNKLSKIRSHDLELNSIDVQYRVIFVYRE